MSEEEENRVEKADSIVWMIGEDESTGALFVKVVMSFEDEQRDVAIWIQDTEIVQSLGQLCEDFARRAEGKDKEEQTIDAVLEKIAHSVALSSRALNEAAADGVRFEEAVLRMCMAWRMTKLQAKSVLALMLASLKLAESEMIRSTDKRAANGMSGAEHDVSYQ